MLLPLVFAVVTVAARALGAEAVSHRPPRPPQPAPGSVVLDWSQLGATFEGLGALSGGGAV